MPRGDGTGPTGKGPMTGRGMGYCIKEGETGESSYIGGGTMEGIRRWFGRGRCRNFSPVVPDKAMLEKEKTFLLGRLKSLEKELEKMDQ